MIPKYVLKDLSIGSGSIIGRDNIEEFFNHVSRHEDIEDKPLVELAPDYETAVVCLVQMLEARFASLNPFMQQMFLKLQRPVGEPVALLRPDIGGTRAPR